MAYVYKITFEEVPHFYFGVRGRDPEGDDYLGSPVTHKCYWEIYVPKKQILGVYDSWKEACSVEMALIQQNWDNRYCLNQNANGAFPREVCSRGGEIGGCRTAKRLKEDEDFAKTRAEAISTSLKKAYAENPQLKEQKSQLLRTVSKKGNQARLDKMGRDVEYKDNLYSKVADTKKRRYKEDLAYRDRELDKLRRAREAYDRKLETNPEFREIVIKRLGGITRGTIWVNNGSEEKRISKTTPIPPGFTKGRIKRK